MSIHMHQTTVTEADGVRAHLNTSTPGEPFAAIQFGSLNSVTMRTVAEAQAVRDAAQEAVDLLILAGKR